MKVVFEYLCINNTMFSRENGQNVIETSPLICSANQWTDFHMRDLRHERVGSI